MVVTPLYGEREHRPAEQRSEKNDLRKRSLFIVNMRNTLLILLLVIAIQCQRIKDSIYTDIQNIKPCFRRLNGTHEIGCSSSLSGDVGVVVYLDRMEDIETLLVEDFDKFVVLLDPAILSGNLLYKLKESGRVAGLIIPSVTEGNWTGHYPQTGFSTDTKCPNAGSSFFNTSSTSCREEDGGWNPTGSGAMWEDWGFAIFLVQDSKATSELYSCWMEHNQPPLTWPLCSVELKANMYAAKDSETCVRRSNLFNITPLPVCDQLADNNILYFVKPRNATTPSNTTREESDRSVVVVAARLDALSLFDQAEVGFDSPSTGLVSLLATAHAVAEGIKSSNFQSGIENVLFLLIHGESFNYIGSSRIVYDMQNDAFPFNLTDAVREGKFYHNGTQPLLHPRKIKYWVELGQLGMGPQQIKDTLYIHSHGETTQVTEALKRHRGSLEIGDSKKESLPPCSAQSMLGLDPSLPTVLLTNFDDQYENEMYHSIFDSALYHGYNYSDGPKQPVVQRLASVASMVASTILSESAPPPKDQSELVNELLHCYTVTANCTMFHEASEPGNFPWLGVSQKTPFPQYVGVRSSAHTMMTRMVLQYLTGEKVDQEDVHGIEEVQEEKPDLEKSRADCLARNAKQNVFRHIFLVGKDCYNKTEEVVECGNCYRTTVDTSIAASPAFLPSMIETYDWESGLYPTWTESVWKVISARIFLQGDPSHDHGVLALGVLILVLSLSMAWWLQGRADTIFGVGVAGGACLADPTPVNM